MMSALVLTYAGHRAWMVIIVLPTSGLVTCADSDSQDIIISSFQLKMPVSMSTKTTANISTLLNTIISTIPGMSTYYKSHVSHHRLHLLTDQIHHVISSFESFLSIFLRMSQRLLAGTHHRSVCRCVSHWTHCYHYLEDCCHDTR